MFDFTLTVYKELLLCLKNKGYTFIPFVEYYSNFHEKIVILRHDVDVNPINSLKTAIYENSIGIKGTYYFRIVPESNNPQIIKSIVELGHEIGYHYEDLAINKGDFSTAIISFRNNLEYFRKFYPVKTICMHGSPLSRWDNRMIWHHFKYQDFGLIAEPYFDFDFTKMLYLTDTGRMWNGNKYSVRDKIPINSLDNSTSVLSEYYFHSTFDFLKSIDQLPDKIMLTVHPQRWTNSPYNWMKELIFQNAKNLFKRYLFVKTKY